MSWFDQRIARSLSGTLPLRGQHSIFHEVCQLDFAGMSEAQRVFSLLSIAQHLAGIEGLGEATIRLARETNQGTASATFLDAPKSLTLPIIHLDRRFFSPDVDLDVFLGLVLHEVAHLKFTRRFYREAQRLSPFERFLCNLIEDYRIERLLGSTSRAWQTYLERTRLLLVEQDGLANGLRRWPELGELDRVMLLLSLFLFMPEVLAERQDLQTWQLADGVCPFAELQEILATEPLEEDAVFTAVGEILQRFGVCAEANRQSREEERLASWQLRGLLQAAGEWSWEGLFGNQLARSQVTNGWNPLLVMEVESLERAAAGEISEMETESWDHDDAEDKSPLPTVVSPVLETQLARDRYRDIAAAHRAAISELQMLFADPVGSPNRVSGQQAGRLDPRRLYRHSFDGRVFQQPSLHRRQLAPTTLGLLIDASGSMRGWPAQAALRIGVILCEAFQEARNVDIRIFSHVGKPEQCELLDLGDKQTAAGRLGSYAPQLLSNYDDLAIERVAQLLEGKPALRRVLFVLSDAKPTWRAQPQDRERWSMTLTREAVESLRQRGWRVIGLTIGQGAGNYIYGRDRVHLRGLEDIATHFPPLLRSLFST